MTTYREIEKIDNEYIASIIRQCLTEFGANKLGTVFYDSSTDEMWEYFKSKENSIYLPYFI